jgi:hypothetical protein
MTRSLEFSCVSQQAVQQIQRRFGQRFGNHSQVRLSQWLFCDPSDAACSNAMNTFESTFAPLPPPDPTQAEIDMLIALITLGTTAAFAPFFNSGV